MLLEDFYTVASLAPVEGSKYQASIRVNAAHAIFGGHFPDNPIMPGVCMMQIVRELTEQITGKRLLIQNLSNVKFMALIDPRNTPDLRLDIEVSEPSEDVVKVRNTTFFDETVALKLNCTYKTQ